MDFTTVVGNTALVCTIASNLAGLPLCVDFFKKRTTLNASVVPFLAGAACTSLWFMYSILMKNGMLQVVNCSAAVLQTTYVCCFYLNTPYKEATFRKAVTILIFLSAVYAFAFHILEFETGIFLLGYLASGGSILACASPLVNLKKVLKDHSSDSLPFPIISSTFIMTSLWFIYGILIGDNFIQVPNLTGSILSLIQLSFFLIYPSKKSTSRSLKKD